MVIVIEVDFRKISDPALSRLAHPIPQLFDSGSSPWSLANLYLRGLARRLARKSIKTTAEHLKEFIGWMGASGLDVEDITDHVFDSYVDALCAYKKNNGDPLSWNTVNARASGAYRYLIWCYEKGCCPQLSPVELDTAYGGVRKKYKAKGHPSKKLKDHTDFLDLNKAIELVDALSQVSGSMAKNVRRRNKLIGALMLQSGLRVSEVVNFPLKDLPEVNFRGHSTPARVKGKGDKQRLVLIPNSLLLKIWEYVDFEREKTVEIAFDKQGGGKSDSTLFLNECAARLSINWVEKLFALAGNKVGVKASPHVLRHTYGTYHYLLNRDLAGLSKLMGHADEETTRSYYVETAVLVSYSGSYSALQEEIDRIIEVGC